MSLNMSLYYVFTHSFNLPEEYACPDFMTKSSRKQPLLGAYFLISGIVFLVLYFLCFLAVLKLNLKIPVYQLMLVLSIFDILSLSVNSVATGIFDIIGISFCQCPHAIFFLGAIGQASWMSGSACSILLAVERCVEINPKFILERLFRKRVFCCVLATIIIYSIWSVICVQPVLFSIEYSSWFFDPLIGNDPDIYLCNPDTVNNWVLLTTITALYFYLSYHLLFKFGYSTSIWLYKTRRQIIFQALMLCVFHGIVCGIYEFMKYVYFSHTLVILSQLLWGWSSGCMCIAYLAFNRTIRNSVLKISIPKSIRERYGLHVGFEEHLAQTEAAHNPAVMNAAGSTVKMNNFIHF
ncbi:Serpentine Receptor, class T [Caenorhabditis elegans]|uniref:Serpentine Receptor, class T n=1 Tax=Caenorhabditis elegans TaxID=6239 RepID=O16480_CAEEL|nr:Serpentine Receptor, class T [Caenorhabditis elegans]CCD67800.1 Serpentine Receptor, class T [Caenorhabditis elegans]|eukprot:NP_503844.1 Serpentine Receptor, class T [Caenorhabditis elegans]